MSLKECAIWVSLFEAPAMRRAIRRPGVAEPSSSHRTRQDVRYLLFDTTCVGQDGRAPLSWVWRAGARLFRLLGRFDGVFGARSWPEALDWLTRQPGPITEVQFWGHGRFGRALIDRDVLDARALSPSHPLYSRLCLVRDQLEGPKALWWWRTCETYGADSGHAFAAAWTAFLGCRTAGHTHVIAAYQSGLVGLHPGQHPFWPADLGILRGTPASPELGVSSRGREVRTIHLLTRYPPPWTWEP